MGLLSDEEVVDIRARFYAIENDADSIAFYKWVSVFDASGTTINNIINDISYLRPTCYPPGTQGRVDAEQRERNYQELQKHRQRMRYVSAKKRKDVLERDGYKCVYCSADLHTEPLAIDHKVPVSAGGTNDTDNLQVTCKVCNARKKHFNGPDSEIRAYLDRRRQIDGAFKAVEAVLTPIIEQLSWSDKEQATCPWCGNAATKAGDIDEFPNRGFVWECQLCKRYFTIDGFTELQDYLYAIRGAILGSWYADDEARVVVSSIMADEKSDKILKLVAASAGDYIEVERRQHHHDLSDDGCWCEYGVSEFRVTGNPIKQIESR